MDSQHPVITPLNSAMMKISLHASYSSNTNHIISGVFSNYRRTLLGLHVQIDKFNFY